MSDIRPYYALPFPTVTSALEALPKAPHGSFVDGTILLIPADEPTEDNGVGVPEEEPIAEGKRG